MSFLLPLLATAIGIGATNVQQKAAVKNNEVQQASAVGNSQAATQAAQSQLAGYESSHPAPFTGATMTGPRGMTLAPAQGNTINASSLLGKPVAPSGPPGMNPAMIQQLIAALMKAAQGQQKPAQRRVGVGEKRALVPGDGSPTGPPAGAQGGVDPLTLGGVAGGQKLLPGTSPGSWFNGKWYSPNGSPPPGPAPTLPPVPPAAPPATPPGTDPAMLPVAGGPAHGSPGNRMKFIQALMADGGDGGMALAGNGRMAMDR